MAVMQQTRMEKRSFETPDDTRRASHFRIDTARVGDMTIGKAVLQPGWRWSKDMKPVVGTEMCMVAHTMYQVSGVTHVAMSDGTEMDVGPGEIASIPSGHDAWVVGGEPAVSVDFGGHFGVGG